MAEEKEAKAGWLVMYVAGEVDLYAVRVQVKAQTRQKPLALAETNRLLHAE